ncbi:MAG TPA: hypothetical protein VF178_08765, partial [Gemmatimonadaceae bacterium]
MLDPVIRDLNAHLAQEAEADSEAAHVESCEQDAIDDLMRDEGTVWDWFRRDTSMEIELLIDQPAHIRATIRQLVELFNGGMPAPHPSQSERQDARYDRIETLIDTLRDAYEQWLRDSGVLRTTAEAMAERQRREAEEAEAEDAYFE